MRTEPVDWLFECDVTGVKEHVTHIGDGEGWIRVQCPGETWTGPHRVSNLKWVYDEGPDPVGFSYSPPNQ